jgi:nitroreductase
MSTANHKATPTPMIKQLTQRFIPSNIYNILRLAKRSPRLYLSALHDLNRYIRHSSAIRYDDQKEKLRALITARYHNLEKGLSLPEPRLGFGRAQIDVLIRLIEEYIRNYGSSDEMSTPISVIGAYIDYHEQHGFDVTEIAEEYLKLLGVNARRIDNDSSGGTKSVSRHQIENAVSGVSSEFFFTRHSCRQFSNEPIATDQIVIAARIAQKSPAVCNRQSGKIHTYIDTTDIEKILELQGGARGFSQSVKALFCITVDIRNFHGVGERYQGWIDGGLFAMSFILGLHMQQIGTCCLNWSKESAIDDQMHDLLALPDHESIIMFIAAGQLDEDMVVARSNRKKLPEVLTFNSLDGSVAHTDESVNP